VLQLDLLLVRPPLVAKYGALPASRLNGSVMAPLDLSNTIFFPDDACTAC
jgi:hypothetical protein